jgi:hypothetical protein
MKHGNKLRNILQLTNSKFEEYPSAHNTEERLFLVAVSAKATCAASYPDLDNSTYLKTALNSSSSEEQQRMA